MAQTPSHPLAERNGPAVFTAVVVESKMRVADGPGEAWRVDGICADDGFLFRRSLLQLD